MKTSKTHRKPSKLNFFFHLSWKKKKIAFKHGGGVCQELLVCLGTGNAKCSIRARAHWPLCLATGGRVLWRTRAH